MGAVTDFFFGKKDKGSKGQFDPYGQELEQWKLGVGNMLTSGQYPSQEYINKVVIPSTMNQSILMGQGRSGAATEAVSHATLGANYELLKAMLGGIGPPSTLQPRSGSGSRDVGAFDWLEKLGGAATAVGSLRKGWPFA